jgi:LAGLIDADG endonuclease
VANLRLTQDAGSRDAREATDLPSYISGYVDGEGCFNVSIGPRPTLRVGWEVRPSVSVSQNGDRSEVLTEIQRYFGCGTIRPDRSDQTLK